LEAVTRPALIPGSGNYTAVFDTVILLPGYTQPIPRYSAGLALVYSRQRDMPGLQRSLYQSLALGSDICP